MSMDHPFHEAMLQAVALAEQARWQTWPNPCVGAVLVRDGAIVASGWHKGPGRAHAEVEAISQAREKGIDPADCTLVVTLEPCRHYGKTPPCTEAILQAGIRRLVTGCPDPNAEAAGGAEYLRSRGLQVECGVALQECTDLLDEFLIWKKTALPYVMLKLASSLDGRIATRSGHSRWISSEESRRSVHELRSHVQAVLIGGNTFYTDNPRLTCRLPEGEHSPQPLAVVLTSRLPEPGEDLLLLRDRPESLLFLTSRASAYSPRAMRLRENGVRIEVLHDDGRGGLDLADGLSRLRKDYGCRYVLCEGGGKLGLSLLEQGLARELFLHLSPLLFADSKAVSLFDGRAPEQVHDALALRLLRSRPCGPDLHLTLKPLCTPWQQCLVPDR